MAEFWVKVKVDPSQARRGAGQVKRSLGGIEQKAQKLHGVLLRTFGAIGLAAGAGAGIKVLANFSQEMSTVQAITGATADQFGELRDVAKDLGATTRFSASDAAEGMKLLARSGFEVSEVAETIDDTLRLAQAGALNLGEAANISANVLRGFRLEADQATRVVDVLALAANSANTDVRQLGDAMRFVAPVAAGVGISIEETAAAIAKLSDAGLQASMAGTGLRRVLSTLEAPTAAEEKILARLGVTAEDVRVSEVGLTAALKKLAQAGIDTGGALELFGDRGGPAFEVLVNAIPGIEDMDLKLQNAAGTALRISEIMDDNLNGALFAVKSAFEAVIIAIGDLGAESGLTKFFREFADILRTVAKNIHFVGRAAKVAGIWIATFFVAKGITAAAAGLQTLTVMIAANPIGALLIALGAAISLLIIFGEKLAVSSDGMTTLGDVGKATFEIIGEGLGIMVGQTEEGMDKVEGRTSDGASNIALAFLAIIRSAAQFIDAIMGTILGSLGALVVGAIKLPAAIAEAFFNDLNRAIRFIEDFANKAIRVLNKISGVVGIDPIGEIDLQEIENKFVGAGREMAYAVNDVFAEGFNQTILTDAFDAIMERATKLSAERRKIAPVEPDDAFVGPPEPPPELAGAPTGAAEGAVDPAKFQEYLAGLRLEGDLLRLNAAEYEIQQGLLQAQSDLKGNLNEEQARSIEEQLRLNQALQMQAQIYDEIKGPQEELLARLEALNALKKEGTITLEEYNEAMDRVRMNSLQFATDIDSGVSRGLLRLKKEIQDVGSIAENTLVNAFHGAQDALTSFITTGEVNFKGFVDGILADLTRLLMNKLLMSLIPGLGGGASAVPLPGFQHGGSFKIGGSGGPDSRLVAFRGTPGERVDVSRPGQTPNVNVEAPQVNLRVVNVDDPSTSLTAMGSSEGEKIIVNTVRRNINTIKRM